MFNIGAEVVVNKETLQGIEEYIVQTELNQFDTFGIVFAIRVESACVYYSIDFSGKLITLSNKVLLPRCLPLSMNEIMYLRDYLRYDIVNIDTLSKRVIDILNSRKFEANKEVITFEVSNFFNGVDSVNLKDISAFIRINLQNFVLF